MVPTLSPFRNVYIFNGIKRRARFIGDKCATRRLRSIGMRRRGFACNPLRPRQDVRFPWLPCPTALHPHLHPPVARLVDIARFLSGRSQKRFPFPRSDFARPLASGECLSLSLFLSPPPLQPLLRLRAVAREMKSVG